MGCSNRTVQGDRRGFSHHIAPMSHQRSLFGQLQTVTYIVDDHPFPLVETDPEAPFLPIDDVTGLTGVRDGETCPFRLHDIQRFQVGAQFMLLSDVLAGRLGLEGLGRSCLEIVARWQKLDADDFRIYGVDYGRNGQREGIVVGVEIGRIHRVPHVEEALVHPPFIVEAI